MSKKKNYRIDYYAAVHWCNNHYIMLNNIHEIDPDFNDPFLFDENEDGSSKEIFQYFISDCSEFDKEFLVSNFPELLFAYSDKLQKWILCVDHWGNAWDDVFCDISPKSDIPNIWCKARRKLDITFRRDFVAHFKRY